MYSGNWLFKKWWYITALTVSGLLFILGLFSLFPFTILGILGLVTCFMAYYRLDKHQKHYGIRLNRYRFRQWWWWLLAVLSVQGLSSNTETVLIGVFFMILALVFLFMPPGGNRVRFE